MNMRWLNLLAFVLLGVLLLLNSRTVVPAPDRGVMLRFGEITRIGLAPGVYWRLPLIDTLQRVDMRARFSDLEREDYADAQGDHRGVEAWVVWRIRDLPRYYLRTGADPVRAAELLRPVLHEGLQRGFAATTWAEQPGGLPAPVLRDIAAAGSARLQRELGIEILSLQLRRVSLTSPVEATVIERMRLARESQATALRAEALEQALAVTTAAGQEQRAVLDEAAVQAARLRDDGAREADALQAGVTARDPGLARYWRALEGWRRGFGKPGDVLVLAEDSELAALRRKLHLDEPASPVPGEKK